MSAYGFLCQRSTITLGFPAQDERLVELTKMLVTLQNCRSTASPRPLPSRSSHHNDEQGIKEEGEEAAMSSYLMVGPDAVSRRRRNSSNRSNKNRSTSFFPKWIVPRCFKRSADLSSSEPFVRLVNGETRPMNASSRRPTVEVPGAVIEGRGNARSSNTTSNNQATLMNGNKAANTILMIVKAYVAGRRGRALLARRQKGSRVLKGSTEATRPEA